MHRKWLQTSNKKIKFSIFEVSIRVLKQAIKVNLLT